MSFEQRKLMVLALWVASVSTIGLIFTVEIPSLWIVIATLAIGPAAIASWLWNAPEVTLSELIAKHRR